MTRTRTTTMRMPNKCPSCAGKLMVVRMECASCHATVAGKFDPCPVCTLDEDDRLVFDLFMNSHGNLKEMERSMGLSYPTVRAKVERMFSAYSRNEAQGLSRMDVLTMLREGTVSVEEAEDLLAKCRR